MNELELYEYEESINDLEAIIRDDENEVEDLVDLLEASTR